MKCSFHFKLGAAVLARLLMCSMGFSQTAYWEQTNGPMLGEWSALLSIAMASFFSGLLVAARFRSSDDGGNLVQIHYMVCEVEP